MKTLTILLLSVGFTATAFSQATLVQESFTYADGVVDAVGIGGTGWDVTEGGWQVGNSLLEANRFDVLSGEALYQGGGVGTYTQQNRTFAAPVTSSAAEIIEVSFRLLRPETQGGRGIGIFLTNGGVDQFFIGKEVNGSVGLHDSLVIGSTTYATFGTSGTSEDITISISYNGVETSIVLADSDETLAAHTLAGTFTFDGISLAGYNGATTTNGIDDILITSTPAPDPWLQVDGAVAFISDGALMSYSVPIFNGGDDLPLSITSVEVSGFDAGDVTAGPTFPASLGTLAGGTIDFTFAPSSGGGLYFFDLEITSDDTSQPSPRIVSVEIDVTDPLLAVDMESIDFGSFANNPGPQTATVNVTNEGGGTALTIFGTTITGSNGFSVTSLPASIAPGATESIEITFDPGTQPGSFSAELSFDSNAFNFPVPTVTLTASTELGGTILADYGFGEPTVLDLASQDAAPASVAADLVETDLGSRTEFGLRVSNGTQGNITTVDGNALGWSRREAPNTGLDLSVDAPTEAMAFTLIPGGGVSIELGTDGWLLVDLGAFSGLNGPTGYDMALKVDDGISPFIVGPEAGPSIQGVGADEVSLTFDVRSLGTVTAPVTFTLMPQTTGNTNGTSGQAGGYMDNIILTGTEIIPLNPALFVASPAQFSDEGLGGLFSIPISNTGAAELAISDITTDGSGNASTISNISWDPTLAASGGSGFIDFDFTPDSGPGFYTTNLTITSNDPDSPTTVALEITVLDPEILVTQTGLDFGTFEPGSGPQMLAVTVSNDGEAADLVVTGINLGGTGSGAYSTVLPGPITPGATGDIMVTFDPGVQEGQLSATLEILSNDSTGAVPQVALEAVVEPTIPSGVVVARFNFDLDQQAGTTVDGDSSLGTPWVTGLLIDEATGDANVFLGSNQGNNNRGLDVGPTGNFLQIGSNRESDAQTPVAAGGNDESTWTRFTVSPPFGGGAIDYTGGSIVVDTFASTSLGTDTSADWTLYYSTDGGVTWISLGTQVGATTTSGLSAPLALSWDPTPIGDPGGPVDFILDPVSTGGVNGNRTQRAVGYDNLVVTAGTITPGVPSFAGWAAGFGIPNDPADDSDLDGLAAVLEYGLGLNPTVAERDPALIGGGGVSYAKGVEAVSNGDVLWAIEVSTDLGQTDPWTEVTPTADDDSIISYDFPVGPEVLYARLRVEFVPF